MADARVGVTFNWGLGRAGKDTPPVSISPYLDWTLGDGVTNLEITFPDVLNKYGDWGFRGVKLDVTTDQGDSGTYGAGVGYTSTGGVSGSWWAKIPVGDDITVESQITYENTPTESPVTKWGFGVTRVDGDTTVSVTGDTKKPLINKVIQRNPPASVLWLAEMIKIHRPRR